jgi:hypothetical protein
MAIIRARGEQQTVQLRFRVPTDLAARLERIREEVEAQGYELPVSELVTRALARVATKAEQDLAALRAKTGGKAPNGHDAAPPVESPADARMAGERTPPRGQEAG